MVAVHSLSHILWVSSPILRSCESHKIHQDVVLNINGKHGENCHTASAIHNSLELYNGTIKH